MKLAVICVMVALIFVAGCVQDKPVKEIVIPGQKEIYQFTNDLRASVLVKSNDEKGIRNIFLNNENINIVFDGSSEADNAYFTVVIIDFGAKVPLYLSYQGNNVKFAPFYFIGDEWHNSTDDIIKKPNFTGPVLILKGPNTWAEDTSVDIYNNTVILQGTSYKNLTMAGDKLTLIVLDINKELIEAYGR